MTELECTTCGEGFVVDEMPRRGPVCFRCHLKGIRIGFSAGREDFHGPTITERVREQESYIQRSGIKAEPVGSRWV